jgi:RNA polymerase sigma factor (sigma-70 family)
MENAEQSPEQAQWTAIRSNLDALAQMLDLSEGETLALHGHIAPEAPQEALPDLEPAAWKLRTIFDEWRTQPAAEYSPTQGAIRAGQETRVAAARSIMARLLGRRYPYQSPQPFAALTAERKPFEIPPMVEAVESVTDAMLAFKIDQASENVAVETDEAASVAKLIRRTRRTQPYALETGPELLGNSLRQVDAYTQVISAHPIHTAEEEAALFARMHAAGEHSADAQLARTQLIIHNLRLVLGQAFYMVAVKPRVSHNLGDLIQAGNVALIQSIGRFDPSLGNRLSSLAVITIRKAMYKWMILQGNQEIGSNNYRVTRNKEVLDALAETRKVEPDVTAEEVAARLGYSFLRLVTFDEEHHKEIPDPGIDLEALEQQSLAQRVWAKINAMPDLTPRQLEILHLIYEEGLTLQQIGERQGGVSHQAISQIHNKAINKVRRHFGVAPPKPERIPSPPPKVEGLLAAVGVTPEPGEDAAAVARSLLTVAGLTDREIAITTLRYGLDGQPGLTIKKIQERLSLGDGMARYYLQTALKKLEGQRPA